MFRHKSRSARESLPSLDECRLAQGSSTQHLDRRYLFEALLDLTNDRPKSATALPYVPLTR